MGEMWMTLWVFFFIGLFVIAVVIYDYLDRKKQNQKIVIWKYAIAVIIGLMLMFPVASGIVVTLPRFFHRK